MLVLLFDPASRALLVRFSGTVDAADLVHHRDLRLRFREREGATSIILDLGAVERIAIPTSRVSAAAINATSLFGEVRVVVARSGTESFGLARLFFTVREGAGLTTPVLVHDLAEAFRLLSLTDPKFEPWP